MSFEYSGLFSDLTDTSTEGYAKLLTSGLLVFTTNVECDVFLVGGGGNGGLEMAGGRGSGGSGGSGGGGGYTMIYKVSDEGWKDGDAVRLSKDAETHVIIGGAGEATSFMNNIDAVSLLANGGIAGISSGLGGNGGSGGGVSGYGMTASKGGDGGAGGSDGTGPSGQGQNHTTREFGEGQGTLYAGGGGGGGAGSFGSYGAGLGGTQGSGGGGVGGRGLRDSAGFLGASGTPNTGGGGGGGGGGQGYSGGANITNGGSGGSGGSGIVVIRWRVLGPGPGTGYPAWMTRNGVWVKVNKVMI